MNSEHLKVLTAVESGYCHSMSAADLFDADMYETAKELAEMGYLRRLPAKGRVFQDRFAVTGKGSHKLGTFDMDCFEYPNEQEKCA